jgi:hypothetical protein
VVTCKGGSLLLPSDAAPATVTVLNGNGQTASAGAALHDSLVLRVTDSRDRPVADQMVVFVPQGGTDGTVSPDTSLTDQQGRIAGKWTLGSKAGGQRVDAHVIGTSLVATFVASAGSSSADTLFAIGGNNQTGAAGSTLVDSIVVMAADKFGNPAPAVDVAFGTSGGGRVSSSVVTTGADGHAAVQRVLGPGTGTQTTTATAAGLRGSPVTFNATVGAGSAQRLVLTTQPPSFARDGVPFSRHPVVQIQDGNGNPVAQPGIVVSAALASGPGATLSGTLNATTDASGAAVFGALTITGTLGSYTLIFGSPSIFAVTSNAVILGPGTPALLAIATQPSSSAPSGQPFPQQPAIQVTDVFGNPVAIAGVRVIAGLVSGAGSLTGTLTVTTNASGLAQYTNLGISGATGPCTLNFGANNLTTVVSGTITISVASTGAPALGLTGGEDRGAPASRAVPIAPSDLAADGETLSRTLTVNAVGRAAVFPDLGMD